LIVGPGGVRGTGALVGDNLILTANHVLPDADSARGSTVYFGYFDEPQPNAGEALAPDQLFASSPVGEHDWTLVRLARDLCGLRGSVPLSRHAAPAGATVSIIQHPDGQAMKFASGNLSGVDGGKLRY